MVTTLPGGSVFVMRSSGRYELWAVSADGHGYTGVGRALAIGEAVHLCVWKGNELLQRKSYVLRAGDAEWVDTGIKRIDFGKPPSAVYGYAEAEATIWSNRFNGGSAWLQEATD